MSSFSPSTTGLHSSLIYPPQKKQKKMSVTQTYFLAHTARAKLSREAARNDHDLRLLVGHANLLDSLMLDLAEAEKEQERWFNRTVQGATRESEQKKQQQQQQQRHIQWADTVVEEPDDDWDAEDLSSEEEDSEDDSDYEDEEEIINAAPTTFQRHARASPPATATTTTTVTTREIPVGAEYDEYDDDQEEDMDNLALTRTVSHQQQPPELCADDDSSDDELGPPSPPQPTLHAFPPAAKEETATPAVSADFPLSPSEQSSTTTLFDADYYREGGRMIQAF